MCPNIPKQRWTITNVSRLGESLFLTSGAFHAYRASGKSTAFARFFLGLSCLQLDRPSDFRRSFRHIKYDLCCPEHGVLMVCW